MDELLIEIGACIELGIKSFAPFPSLDEKLKNSYASESHNRQGLYIRSIEAIKKKFPEVCLVTDVAMDPYSSDGHDGIVNSGEILNDETLEVLGKMAVAQAQAGTDIIGPSDMMDGRVGYLDVIKLLKDHFDLPIAAYNVSGEYAMVKAAAQKGWLDGDKIMLEILTSIKRAGADVILSYFTKEFAQLKD